MSNGVKGPGPGSNTPISAPPIDETKKSDTPKRTESTENKEEAQKPSQTGKSPEGLAHDPAVALRKATLAKSAGLTKPTKAQLEEIRTAINDGKKEEAIKLTIKYYNIDTSGAQEVKYVKGKAEEHTGETPHDHHKKIGTGTHKRGDKISIEIGDESFEFKGKASPEWLAGALHHEAFHAKNHFKPDKPVMVREPPDAGQTPEAKMSQQEIAEEIQAYHNEQKAAGKLGFTDDMLAEINNRRNKLYAQLTDENREILSPILRGTKQWPE